MRAVDSFTDHLKKQLTLRLDADVVA